MDYQDGTIPSRLIIAATLFLFPLAPTAANENKIALDLPVKCGSLAHSGQIPCFVQNLVDMDKGPELRDPVCQTSTYNTHRGTDIRVRNIKEVQAGVPIYAMADGVVTALRTNMRDRLLRSKKDISRLRGKECGNGVAIDFGEIGGDKYTSQLCHLARGSIKLKIGQKVKRGQPVGLMGVSGATQFPHIHFSIRKNGRVIDPLTGQYQGAKCAQNLDNSLFTKTALNALVERGFHTLLEQGFADGPVNGKQVLFGKVSEPTLEGPLVYFAKFINLRKGDSLRLSITGPDGLYATNQSEPVPRAKSTFTAYVGKSRPPKSGTYIGHAELIRNGKAVARFSSRPFTL